MSPTAAFVPSRSAGEIGEHAVMDHRRRRGEIGSRLAVAIEVRDACPHPRERLGDSDAGPRPTTLRVTESKVERLGGDERLDREDPLGMLDDGPRVAGRDGT